jgi:hypothetical protein
MVIEQISFLMFARLSDIREYFSGITPLSGQIPIPKPDFLS